MEKQHLTAHSSAALIRHVRLGVGIQDLSPDLAAYYTLKDQKGALVTKVYKGDPADRAGIKANDIIIEAKGKRVSSRDLRRILVCN